MGNVYVKSFASLAALLVGLGALAFLSAWTFEYWQAWVFLGVFGASGVLIMLYLIRYDRELLERRMSAGPTAETRTSQRIIMSLASLGFFALLVVPGLDHRFGWSSVPGWLSVVAEVVIALGMLIVFFVFRENSFTSATIDVAEDQQVVSTGPYALVRHPMYTGSLLYQVAMPVALGSWWGLAVFVPLVPIMLWRISDEERLLSQSLPGYTEYARRTRYRLVPQVW
ncbi:methyltransferase family protein [Nocardia mexicana]|uniref:Protein-S-isoprenylcysteine O-methyltransferase Ste14 n=1 Tax=Nocardia mexicana TaxID=279262 RepID=A0A370HDQ5_9NOCA|nr:isoprenylcysteine carboxylmethyltransferase family protein [Nocardia mexicana]RDI55367.1 protein-S-isoprenylcysteine O-methyltransferase Ste14 [Nocardia mexicana]